MFLVEYKFNLNSLGMYKSEEDSGKNIVNYYINDGTENIFDISIMFNDEKTCEEIYNKLFEGIQQIKNERYILFRSYFEDEKNIIYRDYEDDDDDDQKII